MKKSSKKRKIRLFEGLPVIDADKNMHLSISASDVKHAKKNDPANCAAAIACKKKLNKEVRVFLTRTYVKEKKNWVRFITPEAISREIVAFDRGSAFEPGEYKMNAPYMSAKLGNHRGYNHQNRNTSRVVRSHHSTKQVREFR